MIKKIQLNGEQNPTREFGKGWDEKPFSREELVERHGEEKVKEMENLFYKKIEEIRKFLD